MSRYQEGTYRGTARGVRGPIVVEVTFDSSRITEIRIPEHNEIFGHAYGLKTSPFETFVPKIIEYQSLAVPPVVGTEVVCDALVKAIGDAVEAAGGSRRELESAPVPKPPKKGDSTLQADVVVFGSGIAGLAAAVEAQSNGANVLLVEKQGVTGGSSAICGGKIIAAGTKIQKAQGILDTPERLFRFLKEAAGDYLDDSRIMYFCQSAAKNLEWLEEQGFEVQDVEAPHPSILPWCVHNSLGGGGQTMGWGGGFTVPLTMKFEELGGTILYNTALTELISENGRVSGARALDQLDGSVITVKAGAVILATGGFAANRELVESRYPWMKGYYYNCPESSQGDGAKAAEAVGAQNTNHPYLQTMLFSMTTGVGVNEESGLLVTTEGKRFVNEYSFHSMIGPAVADTGSVGAYYITCGDEPFQTVKYAFAQEATPKADSLEKLAAKIGMEPQVLKATADRYNRMCENGVDLDFRKPPSELRALKGPEYAAIYLQPATSITFGGLHIDMAGQVLDKDQNVIPGLYASGETANTGNFGKGVPSCGYSIGHALHFGRAAARSATGRPML